MMLHEIKSSRDTRNDYRVDKIKTVARNTSTMVDVYRQRLARGLCIWCGGRRPQNRSEHAGCGMTGTRERVSDDEL